MAKTNISFNDKNYNIEIPSAALAALQSHFFTVMNGTGATINLGGTTYNVDSAKLTSATNDFVSHLGKISGNGYKVVVNGVEYGISSDKVASAVGELEVVLGSFNTGEDVLAAGLYEAGAIALYESGDVEAASAMLITPWDELIANGTIHNDNGVVYTNFNINSVNNSSYQVLAGDLILPDDVTSIGNYAFTKCSNLTSITIPDGVTSIVYRAFFDCSRLTSIMIPNSVTSIGGGAFQYCSSLTSITIPDGVTSIGIYAFKDCTGLESLTFAGTITQWNAIEKDSDWNYNVPATYVQCSDGQVTL